MSVVEFYDKERLLARVDTAMIPICGTYISIKKVTWKIARIAFALDYSDERDRATLRCNVDLERNKEAA